MIIDQPTITGSLNVPQGSEFSGDINVSGTLKVNDIDVLLVNQSSSLSVLTSSYSENSNLLDGLDSVSFLQTGSFQSYTSSFSSSVATTTNNLSGRITTIESNYTTTGSNVFIGNQVITGSINTTGNIITSGQIIAQTLNVQQVTSSVVYSSGSNIFGNDINNTHHFTGSVLVSGSLYIKDLAGVIVSGSGYNKGFVISNDGGGSTSNARLALVTLNTGGDPYITFEPTVAHSWVLGVDNSDSDTFKISNNTGSRLLGEGDILSINRAGNVGIGTTSPNSKLHIEQSIVPRITLLKTGIVSWYIGNPTQGTSNDFTIGTDSGGYTNIFTLTNVGSAVFTGVGAASYGTVNLTSSDPFIRLTASGGTTDKLKWDIRAISASGSEALEFRTINDANTVFSSKLWLSHGGDIGMGTTSPVTNLHIVRNTNVGIRVQSTDANGSSELDLLSHGTQNAFIDYGPNKLLFRSTNADMTAINNGAVLVLQNDGNVGIGTTNPTTTLQVNGTTSSGVFTVAHQMHGIKYIQSDLVTGFTINLVTEFPEVLLVEGKTWGVIAKMHIFKGGAGDTRILSMTRNSAGVWGTGVTSVISNSGGTAIGGISASGSSITILTNAQAYITLELTVMVR